MVLRLLASALDKLADGLHKESQQLLEQVPVVLQAGEPTPAASATSSSPPAASATQQVVDVFVTETNLTNRRGKWHLTPRCPYLKAAKSPIVTVTMTIASDNGLCPCLGCSQ